MTKLDETTRTAISITFIVMNLEKWLKAILSRLISALQYAVQWFRASVQIIIELRQPNFTQHPDPAIE